MTRKPPRCPECDTELDRDEVDIGVGIQYGSYFCPMCGWTDAPEPLPIPEETDDIPW